MLLAPGQISLDSHDIGFGREIKWFCRKSSLNIEFNSWSKWFIRSTQKTISRIAWARLYQGLKFCNEVPSEFNLKDKVAYPTPALILTYFNNPHIHSLHAPGTQPCLDLWRQSLLDGWWSSRSQTGKINGQMLTCRWYIPLHQLCWLTSELPTQWKRNMKRPCRELRRTNINSNTTRCLLTASNPNNQLIPSRGVRMTTPFTPALKWFIIYATN